MVHGSEGPLHPHRHDKPEPVARTPRVAVAQVQIVIDLLEDELVAMPCSCRDCARCDSCSPCSRQGLPEGSASGPCDQQSGSVSGIGVVLRDLVIRGVGKERGLGVDAPRRQPTGAGDKEPVVELLTTLMKKGGIWS